MSLKSGKKRFAGKSMGTAGSRSSTQYAEGKIIKFKPWPFQVALIISGVVHAIVFELFRFIFLGEMLKTSIFIHHRCMQLAHSRLSVWFIG